jgi:uncharacterized RDD family membrane protein YckC
MKTLTPLLRAFYPYLSADPARYRETVKTVEPSEVCRYTQLKLGVNEKVFIALIVLGMITGPLFGQDAATPDDQAPPAATNSQVVVEDADQTSQSEIDVNHSHIRHDALVKFRSDAVLKTNDSAEAVVAIGSSAEVHGKVREAVVAIGGDIVIDGEARDVIAILGGVKAGPGAKIRGDVVCIGGGLDVADGATLTGKPVVIDLGGLSTGLRAWLIHCLFKLRPLAPQVGWVWVIGLFFFLIYLIIALIMPGTVLACATEINRRPATTFFMGLLTKMLLPLIIFILVATGIGAVIVPFFGAALAFGALIGKTALFEALGLGIGRRLGVAVLQNSLIAFILGIGVITILYMVPVIGFLALGIVSVWGLGGAVTAAFGAMRRETPEKPAAPAAAAMTANVPPAATAAQNPGGATTVSDPSAPAAGSPQAAPTAAPGIPEAFSQRRANFWERMGAGFLDFVIVGILGGLTHATPLGFLVALAYFAGMWTWKGTTVGGALLGLKVVRLDAQPVTFMVALVRALAAAFSIFFLFLGFLWIAWDREKQGWHDKIAGTVVVRLPRSVPLVCL